MRAQRTHLEVLRSELELSGATVVDVGCGAGALSHLLAEEGARIVGVDPSADAIARAAAGAGPRERYLVGFAQDLPVSERYADAVTFLNSLHHVSVTALGEALAEAGRVLRQDGIVYVQEPLAEGQYFEVVRLLDDETNVRAAAQRALRGAHSAGLEVIRELEYDALVRHRDFGAFRDRMLLTGENRASAFGAHAGELEERFHRVARRDRDGWSFLQPTRVTLLKGLQSKALKPRRTIETKRRAMSDEVFERGLATRREVLGEEYVDAAMAGADDFNRDFQRLVTEYCWGAAWGRGALTRRDRSLLNLVMLGALGRAEEFKLHTRAALRNGCTREEIKDALIQLAVYAGVPAGVEAFRHARSVFSELDAGGSPD